MCAGARKPFCAHHSSNSVQSYTKKSEIIAFSRFFYDIYSPLIVWRRSRLAFHTSFM